MYNTVYDISVTLGEESIDYPGDTPYAREWAGTIADNGIFNLSKLVMSAHSGTHIDMPAHFIEEGATLDGARVGDFILPARVVEIGDKRAVGADELSALAIDEGEALLFKTDNSRSGRCRNGVFAEDFVYLTAEAAALCVQKKCRLVGIDYITIEKFGDTAFPAHHQLLAAGVLVLEGIDLSQVPAERYTLFCLPLKIKGGEASPVRAVLLA